MKNKRTNRSARRRDAHNTRIARKHAAHEKRRDHRAGDHAAPEPARSFLPAWITRALSLLSGKGRQP